MKKIIETTPIPKEYLQSKNCGLFRATSIDVKGWDKKIFHQVLMPLSVDQNINIENYTIDIKVHMLMPNQYPCIPNWHYDMVPRDENMNQDFSRVTPEHKMYVWVSGEPLTIFYDDKTGKKHEVNPHTWYEFDQLDLHKGQMSKIHTWRMFIRLVPKVILPPVENQKYVPRRHTQVYLDASNFTW